MFGFGFAETFLIFRALVSGAGAAAEVFFPPKMRLLYFCNVFAVFSGRRVVEMKTVTGTVALALTDALCFWRFQPRRVHSAALWSLTG